MSFGLSHVKLLFFDVFISFLFAFLLLDIISVRFSVTLYLLFNLVHAGKPEKL